MDDKMKTRPITNMINKTCVTYTNRHISCKGSKKKSHVEVIPRPFHVSVLDEVAMWQAFSKYFSFALSIIFYEHSINIFHLP